MGENAHGENNHLVSQLDMPALESLSLLPTGQRSTEQLASGSCADCATLLSRFLLQSIKGRQFSHCRFVVVQCYFAVRRSQNALLYEIVRLSTPKSP